MIRDRFFSSFLCFTFSHGTFSFFLPICSFVLLFLFSFIAGDMTTVHKLRRITRLATETGTISDYVSAASLHVRSSSPNRNRVDNRGVDVDRIDSKQFEGILRTSWLDLTDPDVEDILRRFLPEEDGLYSYTEFLSLSVATPHTTSLTSTEDDSSDGDGYDDDFEKAEKEEKEK